MRPRLRKRVNEPKPASAIKRLPKTSLLSTPLWLAPWRNYPSSVTIAGNES